MIIFKVEVFLDTKSQVIRCPVIHPGIIVFIGVELVGGRLAWELPVHLLEKDFQGLEL